MPDRLQRIPGVGPQTAEDLRGLGIHSVRDLVGQDPQLMYKRICLAHGRELDRGLLYIFRCAVYYATERRPDPELLKWWNWADDAPRVH